MGYILFTGTNGDLGRKLTPTYEACQKAGIKVVASDIVAESQFKPEFDGFEAYFNLASAADRAKLHKLGQAEGFDVLYEGTWPDCHILDLLDWQSLCKLIIVTKPFVSIDHYPILRALFESPGYCSIVQKVLQQDHYISKPALEAVVRSLPAAHGMYGKFARMVILITERRTVNDQRHRLRALKGGMIPDLDSHAVMAIQQLLPVDLVWEDDEHNRIKRSARRIEPTACVRAQMRNAKCNQDVDTACIVEYKVTEKLNLIDGSDQPGQEPIENSFYALVVCAKGLQATSDCTRDLKAIEVAFQGQGQSTGVIDLETNTLNEVFRAVPGIQTPDDGLRRHRGINRPLLSLVQNWNSSSGDASYRELFQEPGLVWENMRLLWETMAVAKKGLLAAYGSKDLIHNFVNGHIGPGNGFKYFGHEGSGWPTEELPYYLMRGQPPEDTIA